MSLLLVRPEDFELQKLRETFSTTHFIKSHCSFVSNYCALRKLDFPKQQLEITFQLTDINPRFTTKQSAEQPSKNPPAIKLNEMAVMVQTFW